MQPDGSDNNRKCFQIMYIYKHILIIILRNGMQSDFIYTYSNELNSNY